MHALWHYLTAPVYQMPTWGPLSIAFLALFSVGFIATVVLYNDYGHLLRRRMSRLAANTTRRFAGMAIPIFAVGLFFFAMRYLEVSALHLHMRLWLYLCAAALLGLVGYIAYYVRTDYPEQVKLEQRSQLKKRYLAPTPAASSADRKRRQRSRKKKGAAGTRA